VANYNVDIALKVSGNSALDQLNKKLKEVEERQEQINKSTLLTNNYLRPRAAAERDFAKFKEKTLEDNRKIAQQEQKILNIAKERASVEQSFLERNREDYKLARQKTAEFLKQQRLLLQMSRQYSQPIGPVASGVNEFRRDKARRQRAQFIASGAPGVPVAGAQQALPAFRERGLQILNNSVKLNESQLRIEAALNGERQRGVRFLEAQSREEKRQLDLGLLEDAQGLNVTRSNLIPGVSSGKAVPRTQHSRPIGPKPARAGGGRGGNKGLSNLALGVGFPLLFGGGVGSVAGGALGSVGGMGGQVLGSAIGGIVDTFVAGIGDIGKALNPLTADIGALADAAGIAGTENGKLIQSLESFVSSEKALELASQQLAVTVGQDGVQALKAYGQANTELFNELSKVFTNLAAASAPFLEQVARAISGKIETVRLVKRGVTEFGSDPTVQAAQAKFQQGKINESQFEQQIAEFVRKKEESAQKIADLQLQSTSGSRISLQIAEQDLIVAQARNNLLDEKAQKAEKNKIALQFSKDTQDILLLQDEKRITNAEAQRRLEEAGIKNDIAKLSLADRITKAKEDEAKAAERQAKAAERRAAAEAKRIQRELEARAKGIASAEMGAGLSFISRSKADLERTAVFEGEEAALNQKLKLIAQERDIKHEILRVQYLQKDSQAKSLQEQELLYETYLNQHSVITATAETEYRRTEDLKERIALTEQISALSAAAGFDVLGLANNTGPFQSTGMYAPDTGPVSFEAGIDLAPLIAYQVELDKILEKYPLIGEAAGAAAGLITTGFESIIDGTKSAEQVFADFLNSIADMLMKTAQQMIAQYIAIAIAKMFAGMGSSFSGSSFSDFSGSITGGNPFAPGGILPTFADGGRPPVGRPSIVGERGPELFVPGASGTIIPNHAMGGVNVDTINITVENTGEQLNPAAQKQLAGQVQGIVLSTLANERRSGGML